MHQISPADAVDDGGARGTKPSRAMHHQARLLRRRRTSVPSGAHPSTLPSRSIPTVRIGMDFPVRVKLDETFHFPSWYFVASPRNTAEHSGRGSPFDSCTAIVPPLSR